MDIDDEIDALKKIGLNEEEISRMLDIDSSKIKSAKSSEKKREEFKRGKFSKRYVKSIENITKGEMKNYTPSIKKIYEAIELAGGSIPEVISLFIDPNDLAHIILIRILEKKSYLNPIVC